MHDSFETNPKKNFIINLIVKEMGNKNLGCSDLDHLQFIMDRRVF
jgi:hypothetical protein